MPVTFEDKAEAIEYMKRKYKEGYHTYIEPVSNGKYKVSVTGTRRDFEAGVLGKLTEEGEIDYSSGPKMSTKTRLHELGHKIHGHKVEYQTLGEYIRNELIAERYAYEKMGKDPDYRTTIPAIAGVLQLTPITPSSKEDAIDDVVEEARKMGIKIDNEALSNLKKLISEIEENE